MHCALKENCLQIILARTLSMLLLVFNILVVSHSAAPFYPTGRLHTEINQKIIIKAHSAALPLLIWAAIPQQGQCREEESMAWCRDGDGDSPPTTLL